MSQGAMIKDCQAATAMGLRVRHRVGAGTLLPLNPFDAAAQLDLVVRLVAYSSLEGMYFPAEAETRARVFVGAERPLGRRHFTCAHELGHHFLNHGEQYDELVKQAEDDARSSIEVAADCFASALLMPKAVVQASFATRGWNSGDPTPEQLYTVATELGVGYSTLVDRMSFGHHLLSSSRRMRLRRVRPKQIQQHLLGYESAGTVWRADAAWRAQNIDLEVNDILIAPTKFEGDQTLEHVEHRGDVAVFRARRPGTRDLLLGGDEKSLKVRIAEKAFNGMAHFRFLEPDEDECE